MENNQATSIYDYEKLVRDTAIQQLKRETFERDVARLKVHLTSVMGKESPSYQDLLSLADK